MSDVCIIVGSDTDLPIVEKALETLKDWGIGASLRIASAHRSPERVRTLVLEAETRGCKVFICAAAGAAHLAGAVAAATVRPVIGIPLASGPLAGVDALYSTVNMPPGIPVATVAVGAWGATNAALLAAQILALGNPAIGERLRAHRQELAELVASKDQALQERLGSSATPAGG